MSSIWICVNKSCSSGRPAGVAKTVTLDIAHKIFNHICSFRSEFILLKYYSSRELSWCDFMKYTVEIVLCRDTSEPIYFKLGMMLDMTRTLEFDFSLNDLMFT